MKIRPINNLDAIGIFWAAQFVCLVAHISYCADLVASPLALSALQLDLFDDKTLAFINKMIPLYALLNASFSIFIFLFLEKLWARFVFFFLTTSITYLLFMIQPGHNMHLLVWTVFFSLLLPRDAFSSRENSKAVKKYVKVMQLQILLIYGIAGVWKLFYLIKSFTDPNLASGKDFLSYAIAHEFVNSGRVSVFSSPLMAYPWLLEILSLGALCVQIFTIFIAPFPRYHRLWGLLIALFHLGTLAILNVFFVWPIFLSLIFLTLPMQEEIT